MIIGTPILNRLFACPNPLMECVFLYRLDDDSLDAFSLPIITTSAATFSYAPRVFTGGLFTSAAVPGKRALNSTLPASVEPTASANSYSPSAASQPHIPLLFCDFPVAAQPAQPAQTAQQCQTPASPQPNTPTAATLAHCRLLPAPQPPPGTAPQLGPAPRSPCCQHRNPATVPMTGRWLQATIVVSPDSLGSANHCHIREAELQAQLLQRARRFNNEGRHAQYSRCHGKHPNETACIRCANTGVADITEACRRCIQFEGVRLMGHKMVMMERSGTHRCRTCVLYVARRAAAQLTDASTPTSPCAFSRTCLARC